MMKCGMRFFAATIMLGLLVGTAGAVSCTNRFVGVSCTNVSDVVITNEGASDFRVFATTNSVQIHLTGTNVYKLTSPNSANLTTNTPFPYKVTNTNDPEDKQYGTNYLSILQLKSIEFTSDHGIMKNNNSDWTDAGTVYGKPDWVKNSATNNPISQTKNTKLAVKVKVKVEPAGVAFDLIGESPNGYASFHTNVTASTGNDQEIPVFADDNLPDQVCILTNSISWKIKIGGTECSVGSSGPHIIYVTYGTPAGSEPTEKRISWSCARCSGQSSIDDIVLAAHAYINSNDPPHFKVDTDEWPPGTPPIWMLLDPSNAGGLGFPPLVGQIPG
ncbi:MAG: hypothetical protein WCK89_22590 [bacterium]